MLRIDNLIFGYKKSHPLFNKITLALPSGNIYGLLGRNGAGKTTLLKMLSGLLYPQAGTLDVEGYEPKQRNPCFLREVFLLTEEFGLPPFDMERYVCLFSPFYPRFDHDLFNTCLREFNLTDNRRLSSLSYGQKKNFLLSFGLATDCRLLLLDEPTNGLDIPSKSIFRKLIASAIHEERTILISTHQVRDMENLIDPILILDAGEIIFFEELERISKKLTVLKQLERPAEGSMIHVEASMGGYLVVRENTDGKATRMNLELLFNAVTGNKQRIKELFNSK